MADQLIIPCPHCAALNRMAAGRQPEAGKCGKCHQPLFAGRPVHLTAGNFDRHASAADLPLLVDFWAEWCGPCRMMAPVIDQAATALEPHVRVGKLDTEAEQGLAARYQIRSIPTLALFRGGREIARISGAMALPQLRRWVEQSLAA